MNKNQFINKHVNLNIPQAELDRKWRVFNEQEMFNNAVNNATAFGGGGITEPEPPPSCMDGWTTINFDGTAFRNGDVIPQATNLTDWTTANSNETPAWCYYNFDSDNGPTYGKLYNYYVVEQAATTGIGLTGFGVSSEADWYTLESCLGTDAGGKMKTTGTIQDGNGLWEDNNAGATNESGFSAIPSGYMSDGGVSGNLHLRASFWTSTLDGGGSPMVMNLNHWSTEVYHGNDTKGKGYSIRLKTI